MSSFGWTMRLYQELNCILLVRSILNPDFGIENVHHRRVVIHIFNSSDLHRKWFCFSYISAETKRHIESADHHCGLSWCFTGCATDLMTSWHCCRSLLARVTSCSFSRARVPMVRWSLAGFWKILSSTPASCTPHDKTNSNLANIS